MHLTGIPVITLDLWMTSSYAWITTQSTKFGICVSILIWRNVTPFSALTFSINILSYSIELPIFNLQELTAVNLKIYPSAFIRFWQQGLTYCPTQEKWTNPFVLTKCFSFWQILLKYNQTQSRSGPKEIGIGVNMGITHSLHRLFLLKSVFFQIFLPKNIPSNRGVITCSNV